MLKLKCLILLSALIASAVSADRIKDLTDVAGVRSNQLVGFGLVVGLNGTGDGKDLPLSAQSLKPSYPVWASASTAPLVTLIWVMPWLL